VRLLARRASGLCGGLRAVASCKGQLVPMTSLKDGAMGRMLGLGAGVWRASELIVRVYPWSTGGEMRAGAGNFEAMARHTSTGLILITRHIV
jgi:hypothetical protein